MDERCRHDVVCRERFPCQLGTVTDSCDLLRAIRFDASRPTGRDDVKKMLEPIIDRERDLPSFAVCLKPPDDAEALGVNDDLFVKDGKSRYPIIGFLSLHSPKFSHVRRTTEVGILLGKEHQGECNS